MLLALLPGSLLCRGAFLVWLCGDRIDGGGPAYFSISHWLEFLAITHLRQHLAAGDGEIIKGAADLQALQS